MITLDLVRTVKSSLGINSSDLYVLGLINNIRAGLIRTALTRIPASMNDYAQKIENVSLEAVKTLRNSTLMQTSVMLPKPFVYKNTHLILECKFGEYTASYLHPRAFKNAENSLFMDTMFYTFEDNRVLIKVPKSAAEVTFQYKINLDVVLELPENYITFGNNLRKLEIIEFDIRKHEYPIPSDKVTEILSAFNGYRESPAETNKG